MARRTSGRRRAAAPAAELIGEVLARHGVAVQVREHRLVTRWAEIVGERVAARAWPDGLKNGVLWVRVVNAAWLQELSYLRAAIVERANALLGAPALVRDLRLHQGRREADRDDPVAALSGRRRHYPPRPPLPAPTVEAVAAIEAETGRVADPELAVIIRALRRRLGL